MARVYPGNLNFRVPDHGTNSDHIADQPRNQDSEKKTWDATNPRGGGGGRGRGRGRGRSEHVRCCYGCGEPGHMIRDCPTPGFSGRMYDCPSGFSGRIYGRRANQDFEAIESTSGASKCRNTPTETCSNSESDELHSKNIEISQLLAKIKHKENELELRDEQIKGLNNRLNKATTELNSAQAKNDETILNMSKLQDDLDKCKTELSSARKKETEISRMYMVMKNKFENLEEEIEAANDEMMKMKVETDQWRKAAKAISLCLDGSVGICSKTPELESLVLYYSNRAAKRVSLGKIQKAIDDCRMAARLDPGFLKVCLTAGNCHLVLGELDDALCNYKKCLESGVVCLDRRLTIEASEGLQNAEKVGCYINKSAELLQKKTSESASDAFVIIAEGLSISCYSEKLLEMKGEALFMLQKYDEVVQMCKQTLPIAEKNCATEDQKPPLKLWRWSLMAKSYFRMGSFDMALQILEKYEQLAPAETKSEEASSFSAATVSELLRCKNSGNEAYKAGRHREAVELYSKAIHLSIESRSFTAICLCNRAAAQQALGEVVDAIADCNLAIALDANYLKAISRRANLHEKIRDYEHAALDFLKLITLLENEDKKVEELRVARRRLSSVNQNLKKEMPLDLYLILGLKGSESASEIKKAYRKAALKHHPDKAGKFLARCEGGGDGDVWKEIFETIHNDADKLFKKIGEAYGVLSDANKRFKYNFEDGMHDDFPL